MLLYRLDESAILDKGVILAAWTFTMPLDRADGRRRSELEHALSLERRRWARQDASRHGAQHLHPSVARALLRLILQYKTFWVSARLCDIQGG